MKFNELLRHVRKSTYRIRVMKAIGKDIKMPMEISKESKIVPNHVSNVLRELSDKGIVVCLNPKNRKGRLYKLTDLGLKIFDEIE